VRDLCRAAVQFSRLMRHFVEIARSTDASGLVRDQGKDAVELLYSGAGYEGHLFDENFTEAECGQVITALGEGDVLTWESVVSGRRKWTKLLTAIGLPCALICIIGFSLEGNIINVILSSGLSVCFALIFYIMVIWK
jgi:hypothetical protein